MTERGLDKPGQEARNETEKSEHKELTGQPTAEELSQRVALVALLNNESAKRYPDRKAVKDFLTDNPAPESIIGTREYAQAVQNYLLAL